MSRYQFDLAGPTDDFEIRQVMANTPMPGSVELSFQHEPSYFESSQVLGPRRETIVCRDTIDGSIVGVASRSIREMHVRNQIRLVGYLGGLRIAPHARNQGLVAGGYRFLRQLHESDPNPPDYYLTTIAENNQVATRVLTSGRAGLPNYCRVCRVHTFLLPIKASNNRPRGCQKATHFHEVLDFLTSCAPNRLHFPAYNPDDFDGGGGTFRNLNPDSVVTMRDHDKLVGVAGIWDQRSFRQTIVTAYSNLTSLLRPAMNQWARAAGRIQLPPVNGMLNAIYACFPVAAKNDPVVFNKLLRGMMQITPSDCDVLLVGHCDDDPLMPITRKWSQLSYVTQLFAVSWDDKNRSAVSEAKQPHYLELGCL